MPDKYANVQVVNVALTTSTTAFPVTLLHVLLEYLWWCLWSRAEAFG